MTDPTADTPGVETVEQKVLRLRGQGHPYARISRQLGLNRGADAHKAFVRALDTLGPTDAEQARAEELTRLDRLAEHVRTNPQQNDTDRARRLKTIQRMRTQIKPD
jgi:hypothetical protein